MDVSECAAALQAQGQMYRLLSQCMTRPTEELVERLEAGLIACAFREAFASVSDSSVVSALRDLDEFRSEMEGLPVGDARLRLEVDYNRLFVGPGHLLAPPYESAYLGTPFSEGGDDALDGENSTDGRQLLKVRDAYRAAGYDIAKDFHDLADNFYVELDFVARLYLAEARALEKGDEDRADELEALCSEFLKEHLAKWVGRFQAKVRAGARLPFYPAVVALACALVAFDAEQG